MLKKLLMSFPFQIQKLLFNKTDNWFSLKLNQLKIINYYTNRYFSKNILKKCNTTLALDESGLSDMIIERFEVFDQFWWTNIKSIRSVFFGGSLRKKGYLLLGWKGEERKSLSSFQQKIWRSPISRVHFHSTDSY
jgi:hypothetical protein